MAILIYKKDGRQYTLRGIEIDRFLFAIPHGINIIAIGQEG